MTAGRFNELCRNLATICERAELRGFIVSLREMGEYTTDIAKVCIDHADQKGWK